MRALKMHIFLCMCVCEREGDRKRVLCIWWVHKFGDIIFSNSLEVYFSHLKYISVVTIWSPKSGRDKLLSNLFSFFSLFFFPTMETLA